MKRDAAQGNSGASASPRRYRYAKVLNHRKHAIRGLWRRNGRFVARITIEDDAARKAVKGVVLEAGSTAEAQEELRKLLVERSKKRLRRIGRCARLGEDLQQTYLPRLHLSAKKPDTAVTEVGHLRRWQETLGPHSTSACLASWSA